MNKWPKKAAFHLMAVAFQVRDVLRPPLGVLTRLGIQPGMHILDFGCGPGSYTRAAARLVGAAGRVYAVDRDEFSIARIKKFSRKKKYANVVALHADCASDIEDNALDLVLLYDVLHDLDPPQRVLEGLHRALKPQGILSVSDHHLRKEQVLMLVQQQGLFTQVGGMGTLFSFTRADASQKRSV